MAYSQQVVPQVSNKLAFYNYWLTSAGRKRKRVGFSAQDEDLDRRVKSKNHDGSILGGSSSARRGTVRKSYHLRQSRTQSRRAREAAQSYVTVSLRHFFFVCVYIMAARTAGFCP
jgi:hypothetical protein